MDAGFIACWFALGCLIGGVAVALIFMACTGEAEDYGHSWADSGPDLDHLEGSQ